MLSVYSVPTICIVHVLSFSNIYNSVVLSFNNTESPSLVKSYTKSKQKFTCKMNKHLTLLEIPPKPKYKARLFYLFIYFYFKSQLIGPRVSAVTYAWYLRQTLEFCEP